MKIITETEHYAVIECPGGNQGHQNWSKAMEGMLKTCEDLRRQGYYPLHYVTRISGWVCEKPTRKDRKTA